MKARPSIFLKGRAFIVQKYIFHIRGHKALKIGMDAGRQSTIGVSTKHMRYRR